MTSHYRLAVPSSISGPTVVNHATVSPEPKDIFGFSRTTLYDMARAVGNADEPGPLAERYLPTAAFGLCALCLVAMVPVTFVALSGTVSGLGYAVPALGLAAAVALLALAVSDR